MQSFSQNCHTIRTKELICMWVCVFSNYNSTVLLQFYAQFYSNSIQIYHCKNHLLKSRGGWAGRNRGWVINFQADEKGWVT